MAKTVKVPSLQHMARNWRDTPDGVRRKLVALAKYPPQFRYDLLFAAVRDMLIFGVSYAQVVESIRRAEKRPWVYEFLIEVLPLGSAALLSARAGHHDPLRGTPRI
jgi:hypothetical protein